jgi:hypothetical protein
MVPLKHSCEKYRANIENYLGIGCKDDEHTKQTNQTISLGNYVKEKGIISPNFLNKFENLWQIDLVC